MQSFILGQCKGDEAKYFQQVKLEEVSYSLRPSSPIPQTLSSSQLYPLGHSLAHRRKESLSAAVCCAKEPPCLPPLCLVSPTASPISFLPKAELSSNLASTTTARSEPLSLSVALRGSSLRLSAFSKSPNPVRSHQSRCAASSSSSFSISPTLLLSRILPPSVVVDVC
ncbi:hypothetical protein Ahy_B09g094641 isoform D [Arachis hypogaea]|uniref:Uncharacterized protein n=1 Tax=Arachis hypogaea TaxID=3818 RepID=A0A444XBV7_ARAHY|nr:hypothetical protein Ahy_B09g094641 isoform D [Arachis hypogaea]